jgi:hypothetical protein
MKFNIKKLRKEVGLESSKKSLVTPNRTHGADATPHPQQQQQPLSSIDLRKYFHEDACHDSNAMNYCEYYAMNSACKRCCCSSAALAAATAGVIGNDIDDEIYYYNHDKYYAPQATAVSCMKLSLVNRAISKPKRNNKSTKLNLANAVDHHININLKADQNSKSTIKSIGISFANLFRPSVSKTTISDQ